MWFKINRERTLPPTSLVRISGCRIEHLQHRHDTIRFSIGSIDPRAASANFGYVDPKTSTMLGQLSTIAENFVNITE
ncbi:hypothetical protein NY2A_b835L [Paramecium bursaria Chlorella virus NY2A]|uniref:Uncharacterized protein b835L n=1 Tax=Paramecium bursaria Chlorella virus NY2A TaxID=46021 RepID=A7IY10_PBCVN|nr:hypothetical protein NY2A_b835L [Paramecium bursaria Chlorella virus NY2A]YP_001498832.1 hypothetical protein AR158_C751L [Paramecium bursaria Chlorella virus AR158]ABT15234.1 hypothetical protein NY2A_b835L [Paramecium bursaria Chlorella virus NY2A]ABU44296.1 hypothetical protein AR158_C751L [Paramecium bursaria Chlorella virus AR158]